MVKFDIVDDTRFLTALGDLDILHKRSVKQDVLQELQNITAQQLPWQRFVAIHGWEPVVWEGDNTYPGAKLLHTFVIQGPSGQIYQLVGSCDDNAIVICAMAVLAP